MPIGTEKIHIDRHPNMVINQDYAPILAENNLLDFDQFYHFSNGTPVKQIRERRVTRVEIDHRKGTCVFFLKRHIGIHPGLGALVTAWLSGKCPSPGMAEFENICEFRENGLPTVVPVAAGERKVGLFCRESFLVTADVAPFISLEKLIYNHPEKLRGKEGQQRKNRIIAAIAHLARCMHEKGFNHRDFNATHVLIGPEEKNGEISLALFDLQRMDRKKWMRFKWAIKILAELSYSMPEPLFNDADRMHLFQTYRKIDRMRWMDRFLFFWIKRKTRRIARHTHKIKLRKQNNEFPARPA